MLAKLREFAATVVVMKDFLREQADLEHRDINKDFYYTDSMHNFVLPSNIYSCLFQNEYCTLYTLHVTLHS